MLAANAIRSLSSKVLLHTILPLADANRMPPEHVRRSSSSLPVQHGKLALSDTGCVCVCAALYQPSLTVPRNVQSKAVTSGGFPSLSHQLPSSSHEGRTSTCADHISSTGRIALSWTDGSTEHTSDHNSLPLCQRLQFLIRN